MSMSLVHVQSVSQVKFHLALLQIPIKIIIDFSKVARIQNYAVEQYAGKKKGSSSAQVHQQNIPIGILYESCNSINSNVLATHA